MIHDCTKAKPEPARGTTAEEQLKLPHITKETTPRVWQAHKHIDRVIRAGGRGEIIVK